MPFTPKFVDLVRNFTTVQGTGPVALGAAVSGYTSLASAAATGDQFYYCIQGVDKPAEREVGRGTMQANDTIAREPISGGLTNFTGGTKTIALVTAAEWFSKIEQDGGGGSIDVAGRAALAARSVPTTVPALLTEAGREGLFVFDGSNLSAKVAADTAQGIYVAPSSDPSGATGAWVRRFDGPVNVKWFGAVGDDAANDGPAFVVAIAVLRALKVSGYGYSAGSSSLFVPAGKYYLGSTTLDISHSLVIEGEGGSGPGGGASILRWAAGTTGLRVQAHNTSGASATDSPTHDSGSGSVIRGLFLKGGYAGTEGEHHGIHLRGIATIRDVFIENFAGNGIHAVAAVGGGTIEGNVNTTVIDRVWVQGCRNGIYFDSADANACAITAASCSANRRWGIWDSSFLGNSYFGCHVAANGWDGAAASIATACVHNGNRYYVKRDQGAGASVNAPSGTTAENIWWGYIGPGAPYNGMPAWANGTPFRDGGAYRTDDANAANLLAGCYSESDQSPSQFAGPTLVVGGMHAAGTANYGGQLTSSNDRLQAAKDLRVVRDLIVDEDAAVTGALTVSGGAEITGNVIVNGGLNVQGNSCSFGPTGGTPTDNGFYIDNTNFWNFLTLRSWSGGSPQTDGVIATARGNGLYLNGTPKVQLQAAGSTIGELTGTGLAITGALSATGAITSSSASAGVGYATGAGGSVTQATSKSTAVTLNKTAGRIITTNSALASAALVAFTVNNSAVAATDTVNLNLQSGNAAAGAYRYWVDKVSAASFVIAIENRSGGSLSEALTFNFAVVKAVTA